MLARTLAVPVILALAPLANAQLDLQFGHVLDLDNLSPGITVIGGVTLDPSTGHLWLAEATGTNYVYEVDASTGAQLSGFPASAVPGLTNGPDSMALEPSTGYLFYFSAANESDAGVVDQSGNLVRAFPSSHAALAAAFDAQGRLFVYSDAAVGGDGALHRFDVLTGALGPALPIAGLTERVWAMDFDPATGDLFAAVEPNLLLQVDLESASVVATFDLAPFVNTFTGDMAFGLTFDAAGERLLFSHSTHAAAELVVLDRDLPPVGAAFCGAAALNSTGAAALLSAVGSEVVSDAFLAVQASQLPPNRFGYLLASRTQDFVPGALGSQGTLCLRARFAAFKEAVASSGIGGTLSFPVDLSALPTSPPHAVQPGETWSFQVWYRDANPGPTSNFTEAVAVAFL